MSSRHIALFVAAVRGVVRIVLLAHPRAFRRRFGSAILDEIAEDVRAAATFGWRRAMRAGASAITDAMAGLRIARRTHGAETEPDHLRQGYGGSPKTYAKAKGSALRTGATGVLMRDIWQDVRHGARSLVREPLFSLAVIVTLALGIGVNTAMFGVADRLLLRGPEHVRDSARVRRLQSIVQWPGMDVQRGGTFGYVTYDALRTQAHSFEAVAAYQFREDGAVLGRGIGARRINRANATASLFPLLGVRPALGRFYDEHDDDTVSPAQVAVIGYGVWQRDFGGRRDVIGAPIVLNDDTYTIVGVAPRGFTGADLSRVDVWLPESLPAFHPIRENWTSSGNAAWLSIVVRAKPGISDAQVDAEATGIYAHAHEGSGEGWTGELHVRPLLSSWDGTISMESRVSTWLLAVTAIVLLVACANVVNLVLARGVRRRRELAVRMALGAGGGRLARLLCIETSVLAAMGGLVGLGIAYGVGAFMRSYLLRAIEWPDGPINLRVFLVCAAASMATAALIGVLPALRAGALDVSSSLKAGARDGGARLGRLRSSLTVVQAALCALLLVGSGLFVASLRHVRALDLGLQPDRILTFSVQRSDIDTSDQAERARERARRASFYPSVLERLRQRPDVEAASLTVGLAFSVGMSQPIDVPGRALPPKLSNGGAYVNVVTADYFKTVGTRIVRGRAFTAADRAGSAPVAIVNETMAAALWPNEDAIGKCFRSAGAPCADVVGIAADARHFQLREDPSLSFYVPFGQENRLGGITLLVRPRGDASHVLSAVRQELVAIDPTITFVDAELLQDRVEPQVRPWMLGATMFSVMGVLALVVAAVGLYSVMAYFVTRRAHEIGIRVALGARPADIVRLVVRNGLALAVGGIVVGFGMALLAARFIEPLLFDTSAHDPVVFAVVTVTLMAVAACATVIPAIRARRIDPVEAMRTE
ncbi:MAG TPA: ABC transporter permease [Vicinamibacterales bacterium]|jgi:predicted permease|nr:ABC transporter permease [Vicinamibacterales bacterium]